MIDANSLDQVFVDDVLYMFDMGESISKIAYIMGCDAQLIDDIICQVISETTSDTLDY